MKIVFLDVDGELTYSAYKNEKTANIDIEKVKLPSVAVKPLALAMGI